MLSNQQGLETLMEDWSVRQLQRHDTTHARSALHLELYKHSTRTVYRHDPVCSFLVMPKSSPNNRIHRHNAHQASVPETTGQTEDVLEHSGSLQGYMHEWRTWPPGQQDTRMRPVANAGDRFSTCNIFFGCKYTYQTCLMGHQVHGQLSIYPPLLLPPPLGPVYDIACPFGWYTQEV